MGQERRKSLGKQRRLSSRLPFAVSHMRSRSLLRKAIPLMIGVLSIVISQIPFGFLLGYAIQPALISIIVFFWAVMVKHRLSFLSVLFLGLVQDLFLSDNFGLWTLSLLCFYALIISYMPKIMRSYFGVHFFGFSVSSFVYYGFAYIVSGLTTDYFPNFMTVFAPYIMTLILFLCLLPPLFMVEKSLLRWDAER